MRNVCFLLLLSLFFGCSKSDFSEANLSFETNKERYKFNDDFELTIIVNSLKEDEQIIRFYKDFSNIHISFLWHEDDYGFNQELKKRFIEGPSLFGNDDDLYESYTISKQNPFKKTFKGSFTELNDTIIVAIPELKVITQIAKTILINNPRLTIEGSCSSVNGGSIQEFTMKDIDLVK